MNQPLNCIIIDDCELDRLHLMSELSKLPMLNIIGNYESCIQAQENISQKNVEVVSSISKCQRYRGSILFVHIK